ncbi:GMC oxidoreductase [Nocardiopsis suaedae]|uniref:Cholesterol oxidase n=1 Tax=Nocardiopsis suaedae TaxID=3018444 RepID=A0ABT4TGH7_9ACTN|nr:GMC family oxidoreductase [Nocardiopsis suaedae]MDA2803797.1 GMC family oxidoreductase [Nocardiopsis suaedae]
MASDNAGSTAPAPGGTASERRYDVLVIGSGFGGAVSALRLTEKGYRVGVLEAGRRYTSETLPRSSWDLKNFIWAPWLGMYGIQRIHVLRDVMILAGAGVGGGSLNYANTLYEPLDDFYEDPQWRGITDWRRELAPYYDQAKRMLGVRTNPTVTPSDAHLRQVAEDMGVGESFHLAPVGVFFGDGADSDGSACGAPGERVKDPYFGGAGPERRACTECGECMTGCRHGAKNMLTENYLYFAEKGGAAVHPMTTVERVRELPGGGYAADTLTTGARRTRANARTFTADQVVVAAGTWGTQNLLHRMRDTGLLPRVSSRLGTLTRTNSESLGGAMTASTDPPEDFSRGVAITSSMHPDAHTHVEPVRYGKGSNAMGMLATIQVPGGGRVPRWMRFLGLAARHPYVFARSLSVRRFSERAIIGLVMQSLDNSLTTYTRRGASGRRVLTSRQGHGEPNPSWIPQGQEVLSRLAEKIDGFPGGTVGEVFNIPLTAHFLGGCPIGDSPDSGVVDAYHRLYGHPGIHVVDGSAVSANLGVNPSLTITAQAERAMSFWPNKGAADPRPAPGEPYRSVAPVHPDSPAVPPGAFAELRFSRPLPLSPA